MCVVAYTTFIAGHFQVNISTQTYTRVRVPTHTIQYHFFRCVIWPIAQTNTTISLSVRLSYTYAATLRCYNTLSIILAIIPRISDYVMPGFRHRCTQRIKFTYKSLFFHISVLLFLLFERASQRVSECVCLCVWGFFLQLFIASFCWNKRCVCYKLKHQRRIHYLNRSATDNKNNEMLNTRAIRSKVLQSRRRRCRCRSSISSFVDSCGGGGGNNKHRIWLLFSFFLSLFGCYRNALRCPETRYFPFIDIQLKFVNVPPPV